jgi:tRNA 2-thiouridine synthesizing protein A
MGDEHRAQLDARGLVCPEPVMLLHSRVRQLLPGAELEMLATDPSTQRDVARFCEFLGHTLVEQDQQGEVFRYLIRKKEG